MSLAASRPEGNRITNYEEYERNVKATDRQSLPSARHRRSMLEGVVDLTDTVDTDVTVQQLPAVTHEFIQPYKHHVTHEQIHREIHEYDVVHRIQPVLDVEVLPTRHYIVDPHDPARTIEIPEADVPADATEAHYLVSSDPHAGPPVREVGLLPQLPPGGRPGAHPHQEDLFEAEEEDDRVPRDLRTTTTTRSSSEPLGAGGAAEHIGSRNAPPERQIDNSEHAGEGHAPGPEPVATTYEYQQKPPKRGLRKRLSMILKQRLRHLRRKSQ